MILLYVLLYFVVAGIIYRLLYDLTDLWGEACLFVAILPFIGLPVLLGRCIAGHFVRKIEGRTKS